MELGNRSDACWGQTSDDKGRVQSIKRQKMYIEVISKLYVQIEERCFIVSKQIMAEPVQKPSLVLIFFYRKENSKK